VFVTISTNSVPAAFVGTVPMPQQVTPAPLTPSLFLAESALIPSIRFVSYRQTPSGSFRAPHRPIAVSHSVTHSDPAGGATERSFV
jgi:hypothetical protein